MEEELNEEIVKKTIERYKLNNDSNGVQKVFINAICQKKIEYIKLLVLETTAEFLNNKELVFEAFVKSIEVDSIEILEFFIQIGIDINLVGSFKDYRDINILYLAIRKKSLKMITFLVQKGVNIHHHNRKDENAFLFAVGRTTLKLYNIKEDRFEVGNYIRDSNSESFQQVKKNCFQILEYLKDIGINIHHKNNHDWNAVMYAADHNDLELLKYLIHTCNIDYNGIGKFNHMNILSILLYCSDCRYYYSPVELEIVQYVVEILGVELKDSLAISIFHLAIRNGNLKVLKYLLSKGIEANTDGMDIHFQYSFKGDAGIFEFLNITNPSLIKSKWINPWRILHSLVENSRNLRERNFWKFKNTFDYFLNQGQNINEMDFQQLIPIQRFQICQRGTMWKMIKLLIDRGSDLLYCSVKAGSILQILVFQNCIKYNDDMGFIMQNVEIIELFKIIKYIIIRSLEINPLSLTFNSSLYSTLLLKKVNENKGERVEKKVWKEEFVSQILQDPPILKLKNNGKSFRYDRIIEQNNQQSSGIFLVID